MYDVISKCLERQQGEGILAISQVQLSNWENEKKWMQKSDSEIEMEIWICLFVFTE